jgi:hypothetical protein
MIAGCRQASNGSSRGVIPVLSKLQHAFALTGSGGIMLLRLAHVLVHMMVVHCPGARPRGRALCKGRSGAAGGRKGGLPVSWPC